MIRFVFRFLLIILFNYSILLKTRPVTVGVENLVENDMDYGGPNATTVSGGMKLGLDLIFFKSFF
jgi:hypothetical protein